MEFHRDLSIGVGVHRPFEPKLIHRIFEDVVEENSEKLAIEFTGNDCHPTMLYFPQMNTN